MALAQQTQHHRSDQLGLADDDLADLGLDRLDSAGERFWCHEAQLHGEIHADEIAQAGRDGQVVERIDGPLLVVDAAVRVRRQRRILQAGSPSPVDQLALIVAAQIDPHLVSPQEVRRIEHVAPHRIHGRVVVAYPGSELAAAGASADGSPPSCRRRPKRCPRKPFPP